MSRDEIDKLAKIEERLNNFITISDEHYRWLKDNMRDWFGKINSYLTTVSERCLIRSADYEMFKIHIKEEQERKFQEKSFLRDKKFQLLIGISLAMFSFIIWFIQFNITQMNKGFKTQIDRMTNERIN